MQVKQIMTSEIATCRPDTNLAVVQPEDPIEKALATMKQFQVRRLPVVAADGTLKGIISMNDIVLASQQKEGPAPADIVSTLSAICAHLPANVAAA